jgi:DNA-binding transcriptional ArsR family regulator
MTGKNKNKARRVVVGDFDQKAYSKYFKAFGDPTRLRILGYISGGEMTVNEIVKAVGLSQPTVSRHLSILKEAEVVIDRRDGQRVYYSLNKDAVEECCTGFCDCLMIIPKIKKSKKK